MASRSVPLPGRSRALFPALAAPLLVAAIVAGGALLAQVEGERGIPPVASSTDIEVRGIAVNVTGANPIEARDNGWREAQRLAWARIGGPELPDARLAGLVSAIVVEEERLGPRRYIARLGVIFDRARAGPLLGGGGERARSAPMLLLPVLIEGGVATMFEVRNPWQRAWAEYQAGASAIDYVRPVGSGGESLLLTYGQTTRRSRVWWNTVLDQFGAADVLVPIARLEHQWPGGPVEGHFTARYGPDSRVLGQFRLSAANPQQIPAMLARAVEEFDRIFTIALANGSLRPDPTLELGNIELAPEILALLEEARRAEAAEATAGSVADLPPVVAAPVAPTPAATPAPGVASYSVQVATPNAAAFDATLGALRAVPGVSAVAITSTAIGGTSVARVSYAGDLATLAAELRARGWQVVEGSNALAISR